jgi:uncharacterized membrane protein YcaP (DUF421 family)
MYTIIHAILGYFFLLLTVRVLSRRPGGQMTLFEFVIVFLIGGVIILSTVGDDRSVTNCVCAVMVIGLLHGSVSWLKTKSATFGIIIDGTPLVLLKDDHWVDEMMKGMRLDANDIMAAARTKGLKDLSQIKYAILERNGTISIIRKDK